MRNFHSGRIRSGRGAARVLIVSCLLTIPWILSGSVAGQQPKPIFSNAWSSSDFTGVLLKAKSQYGVDVLAGGSQGLVVAPPTPWQKSAVELSSERGGVIGFLYTSTTFSTDRYSLRPGAYTVILRRRAGLYEVQFQGNEGGPVIEKVLIEELPVPVLEPAAGFRYGRPCYTLDSRRICP